MTAAMQPRNSAPMSQLPAAQKRKRADTSNSAEPTTHKKRRCLTDSLSLSSSDDLKVMSNVDDRYEILLQSVISSSKIQQRVSAILRHLTPPAQNPDTTATKTSISVLRAKASDAGKLISIAEIAKREIENEQQATPCEAGGARRESQTGRWFQYIALGEELREMERPRDDSVIEETVIGGSDADAGDEDEFEVMKTPFERAIEGRPLVRGVPVMSLFLSRSPIEELRKRYGEQTNILIESH